MVRHRVVERTIDRPRGSRRVAGHCRPRSRRKRPRRARPGRVFAASVFSIDEILSRPFDRDVPMGCTGDRVWASSPQGWAFRDDVHWLYLTNLRAFDLEIRDEHGLLEPAKATYFPSHIHYEGTVRKEMTAAASFTSRSTGSRIRSRLRSCPRSAGRAGRAASAATGSRSTSARRGRSAASISSSSMTRPRANAARPLRSRFRSSGIRSEPGRPIDLTRSRSRAARRRAKTGCGSSRWSQAAFRFQFQHAGDRFYTGLYGLRADSRRRRAGRRLKSAHSQISADKFITKSDILVSVVRVHNPTDQVQTIYVDPTVDLGTPLEYWDVKTGSGLIVRDEGEVSGREPRSLALDGRKSLHGRSACVPVPVLGPGRSSASAQGRRDEPGSNGRIRRIRQAAARSANRRSIGSSAITSRPERPRFSRRHSKSGPRMSRHGSIRCSSRPPIGPF